MMRQHYSGSNHRACQLVFLSIGSTQLVLSLRIRVYDSNNVDIAVLFRFLAQTHLLFQVLASGGWKTYSFYDLKTKAK